MIPAEAVEAAAEAIMHAAFGQELPEAPEDLARAALEAAAPYIRAQAWDEGFDRGFYDPLAGSDKDASESLAVNPYRAAAERGGE